MNEPSMPDAVAHSRAPDTTTTASSEQQSMSDQVMHHPLFTGTVLIPTRPIDEIFLAAKRAILLRDTGLAFTGPSGIGKTNAINMIRAMLHAQFPRLCMFTHDAHNQQLPSIRAFFKHFLNTVGQSEQRGETFDLRQRLVSILVDDARISGINLIVMFIDEANAMMTADFLFLKDVYNDLARAGVQLVTILMGQSPDLEHVINKLRLEGRNDLVGRFATRLLAIRGYNSVEDLQSIFRRIDESQYPGGSGISWSAFFFPRACRRGFALENEAGNFHQAIVSGAAGIPAADVNFPARQTFLAIRAFLLSACAYDSETLRLPDRGWSDAVAYAKIQDAILGMNGSGHIPKVREQPRGKK
jgi:hypothetical protein